MDKKVKFAIIGFGQRGCGLAALLKQHEKVEFTTICEQNRSRAEAFINELGLTGVQVFTSLDEALEKGDFEAAIITVPDFNHREVAVKCCKAV